MTECDCTHPGDDPVYDCVHASEGIQCFFEPICDRCAGREAAFDDYERDHPGDVCQRKDAEKEAS